MVSLSTRFQRLRVTPNHNSLRYTRRILSPSAVSFRSRIRTISSCSEGDYQDYYRYTGGRWLWNEDAQLRERYKRFNVPELQKIAAKTTGAQTCVSMSKFVEGGCNKVFRLVMDNGTVVLARIQNPNAGPPFKTTASEVATMDFARTVLDIPVPKVLSWSAEAVNPVDSEYILMEEPAGYQLGPIWDDMAIDDKLKIVKGIVDLERKLLSVSFTRYGNLYFADDAFLGCEKAEIVGDLPQSLKDMVENRFVIGPVVDRAFHRGERASMDLDRGPWKRGPDYLRAIAQREIAWISEHAAQSPPKPPGGLLSPSKSQRIPEAHIDLYNRFLAVVEYVLPEGEQRRPTLWHSDFQGPNIFVHENNVLSLIDWHGTSVGPLFLQRRRAELVAYRGQMITELPDNYATLEDKDEKKRIRNQFEGSVMLSTYNSETKNTNPILHESYQVVQQENRRPTMKLCDNTWDENIGLFRQCLIRVERHWNEINTEIPCPIHFTDDEFRAHLREGQGYNEVADMWDEIEGFAREDGFTWNECYEPAMEMFAEFPKIIKKDLKEAVESRNAEEVEELTEMMKTTSWIVMKGE